MKLGIFSDLHLEFKLWDFSPADYPEVDFWINAGDTHPQSLSYDHFHSQFGDNYLFIDGNHDFYKRQTIKFATDYCKIVEFKGVKFAGAPMWTDLRSPIAWNDYCRGLIDKQYMPAEWDHETYVSHHNTQKHFLLSSEADVIVSHHLPSYESVHPKFRNAGLNDCFATELKPEIALMKKKPKLWIHGHTHEECDYMIGDIRVICHPRGYPGERVDHKNYKPMIVEI